MKPRTAINPSRRRLSGGRARHRSSGQVIVIFAGAIFLLMSLMALVIDVSWYWSNTQKVQRAADAAALAGAVWLPGDPTTAYARAQSEATKNGYPNGSGITVTPLVDAQNDRRLNVTISTNVRTFFMRVLGIQSIPAARSSTAEYVLPVPMGSPENYYGVFGLVRHPGGGVDVPGPPAWTDTTVPYALVTTTKGFNTWTSPAYAYASDNLRATSSTNLQAQAWGYSFDTTLYGLIPSGKTINGIEVYVEASLSAAATNCTLRADLSWNNGASWTTGTGTGQKSTPALTTTEPAAPGVVLGSGTDTWGTAHTWTKADFASAQFQVRLTNVRGSGCTATARVDAIQLRVNFATTIFVPDTYLAGPATACPSGAANCYQPDGVALNSRGFWGTMNTQGAPNVNGDAYQPYYDTATSVAAPACGTITTTQACYDPFNYYNYAIEMPAGSTDGYVYVFDPVFCEVDDASGTGDRYWGSETPVSSFFDLYDTNNAPYNINTPPQTFIVGSGNLFRQIRASDATMGGSGPSGSTLDCSESGGPYGDGRDFHNKWWKLNPSNPLSGGPTGTVYRLHTTTTDAGSPSDQLNTNGENSFAIFASANGGTPKVYGLGAMQAFTPLTATSSATVTSEFYLAKLDAVHAGKTVRIKLWDPGDTSPLTASISIRIPTSSGWADTPVSYSAVLGTSNTGRADGLNGKPDCRTKSGTNVTSIPTYTYSSSSSTGNFNGCWLTIDAQIPAGYTAQQNGWWKIKYTMIDGLAGPDTSNDVTTWQVQILGNPVHLVMP